jgi:hypothetical protein
MVKYLYENVFIFVTLVEKYPYKIVEIRMSAESFKYRSASITGPATMIVTVTPNDDVDLSPGVSRGLFVGTAGNLRVQDAFGNIVELNSGSAQYHPLRVCRVYASGTTADGIIALY